MSVVAGVHPGRCGRMRPGACFAESAGPAWGFVRARSAPRNAPRSPIRACAVGRRGGRPGVPHGYCAGSNRLAATFLRTFIGSQMRPFMAM